MSIVVSAPAKIHLLGEHAVVYGKPALLAAVDRRLTITICHPELVSGSQRNGMPKQVRHDKLRKIIEPIIKKGLSLKKIPSYNLEISSDIPIGCGLGSSAAISVAYFGAMLLFLGKQWSFEKINALAYEAEKVFHGLPSGGDNATVCFGGLLWFQKVNQNKKIIKHLPFSIPEKLSQNFVFIDTGKPVESTGEMVSSVRISDSFLQDQEQLTRELVDVLKNGDENRFISIIRQGEKNLEKIGAVSDYVYSIIREIEEIGGAAKICGGGGKTKGTGILLSYHKDPKAIIDIAKKHNLSYFQAKLGVEGLRRE